MVVAADDHVVEAVIKRSAGELKLLAESVSFALLGSTPAVGGPVQQWNTYRVELAPMPWTEEQRVVLLAAAVSIDFDFFENNQGSGDGGLFSFFD